MRRNLFVYSTVCCGAFALANLVWAAPLPSKSVPMGSSKSTPPPMDLKITPKRTDPTPLLDKKIVIPDSVGKITPKVEPKIAPKLDSKLEPKITPKVDSKGIAKVEPKITPKLDPKVNGPLVFIRPSTDKLPISPAIKLGAGAKFDVAELARIRPPVDLSKTSGDKLVKMKPPVDFKMKTMDLAKIHIPGDAFKADKLNAKFDFKGQKFILNTNAYKGTNYHLKYGVRCAWGYAYHGHHHCHWHHSVWDPCCGCHYYYDPCCSCYYYWCESDVCYYPCWWFVDYCGCYYPWWMCGGFETYGYHCRPQHRFHIHIGW